MHFLEIEHLNKGWANGGQLKAPYNQLQKFGIPRRYINDVIWEAEQRGLVIVERGARVKGRNYDNAYWLTYAPSNNKKKVSNEWKKFTDTDLEKLKVQLKKKKQKARLQNETSIVSESA